jgi:hypothetical protein
MSPFVAAQSKISWFISYTWVTVKAPLLFLQQLVTMALGVGLAGSGFLIFYYFGVLQVLTQTGEQAL